MNLEAVAGQKTVRPDAFADTLADRVGAVRAGIGEHQCEFVAAEARDHVGFARAPSNDRGRFDQRPAARQVSVLVVDRFESVQIDEEQR